MTLLITVYAAIAVTLIWYFKHDHSLRLGVLCFMYWGAAIMWLVDAIFEYADMGSEYFEPSAKEMLNDSFLGLSVVALGLVIWLIILLIKDPKGTVRDSLKRQAK